MRKQIKIDWSSCKYRSGTGGRATRTYVRAQPLRTCCRAEIQKDSFRYISFISPSASGAGLIPCAFSPKYFGRVCQMKSRSVFFFFFLACPRASKTKKKKPEKSVLMDSFLGPSNSQKKENHNNKKSRTWGVATNERDWRAPALSAGTEPE